MRISYQISGGSLRNPHKYVKENKLAGADDSLSGFWK